MIYRILEIKDPLNLVMLNYSNLTPLTAEEWLVIEELIDLLAPIEAATSELCGSTYSTISSVIPVIQNIATAITKIYLKSSLIFKYRACLVRSIKERFDYIETNKLKNAAKKRPQI